MLITGGSAFPSQQLETQNGNWNQTFESGMTLRDYFAAKALSELIGLCFPISTDEDTDVMTKVVKLAYQTADAMIKERSK